MTRRYRLAPGVYGLTARDGTKLDADRKGIVEVPERYARDAHDAAGDTLLLSELDGSMRGRSSAPGKICAACGFHAYAWQDACPGCSSEEWEAE